MEGGIWPTQNFFGVAPSLRKRYVECEWLLMRHSSNASRTVDVIICGWCFMFHCTFHGWLLGFCDNIVSCIYMLLAMIWWNCWLNALQLIVLQQCNIPLVFSFVDFPVVSRVAFCCSDAVLCWCWVFVMPFGSYAYTEMLHQLHVGLLFFWTSLLAALQLLAARHFWQFLCVYL